MTESKEKKPPKFGKYRGRPPKEGFSNPELIELGEDFLKWIDENDDKSIVHLSQYYSEYKGIPKSYWVHNICVRPEFRPYYEIGMDWMGKKLLKNSSMPSSYGNRFLPIYFKEIAEQELEQAKKKIDYELEKKSDMIQKGQLPVNDAALDILISSIKSLKK